MFDYNTTVLVVDDMSTMRKIVRNTLKQIGFSNFIEAADGQKAWEVLNDNKDLVGLVISDSNMPKATGIDFLKQVRSDKRYEALPFVLLTAESEIDQVKEAAMAGVDNFIVKPFTPAMLQKKLEETHKKKAA